jgi:hypothetical protein
MSNAIRPFTYDDLLQLPDDGYRYEIIDGKLFVSAAPGKNISAWVLDFTWLSAISWRRADWVISCSRPSMSALAPRTSFNQISSS